MDERKTIIWTHEPWAAEESGRTRRRLDALSRRPGVRLLFTTRTDRVLSDLDLLTLIAQNGDVVATVALPGLEELLARRLEPGGVSPQRRLAVVRELAKAGIRTGVALDPILPGINDRLGSIRRVVRAARAAGATFFSARVLRIERALRTTFFAFLRKHRPDLIRRYHRRYGAGRRPPRDYEERVLAMVEALRAEFRLDAGPGPTTRTDPQLALPFGVSAVIVG